jgi:class 3 adenylate cyclase
MAKGGEILLSAEMVLHAPDLMRELRVEEMPPVSRKGKHRPASYYRLAGNDERTDALCACADAARHGGAKAKP